MEESSQQKFRPLAPLSSAIHKSMVFSVGTTGNATKLLLNGARTIASSSLLATGKGLEILSKAFEWVPSWKDGLDSASKSVLEGKGKTNQFMDSVIHATSNQFGKVTLAAEDTGVLIDQWIHENLLLTSILGSSLNQKFEITKIEMSFRKDGRDIPIQELDLNFSNPKSKKAILYLPGLFTDERLWQNRTVPYKKRKIKVTGFANILQSKGYEPVFLRYNLGLPIHVNGKALMNLLDDFFKKYPDVELNAIAYSLGGLVLRSMLYHAKELNKPWLPQIKKSVFLSSPDRGSYLEKLGIWVERILRSSPNLYLQIAGNIGRLRSDSIKDLSFGRIRETKGGIVEDLRGYFEDPYLGELDHMDVYQCYSLVEPSTQPLKGWIGDGIVEKQSLEHLKRRVFQGSVGDIPRSKVIYGQNHFSILHSKEVFHWINAIYL
jgi:hypothetical protein